MASGTITIGNSLSFTVTVKLLVVTLPEASVALKVFVVVPTGNTEPLGKPAVCSVVTVQLSVPTGVT